MQTVQIKPKQSLGQNFLVDQNVVRNIVESLELSKDDFVLEIGPGLGVMTLLVQPLVKKLVAVEVDKRLADILMENFAGLENFTLYQEDFLKFNTKSLNFPTPMRIIGNIPYHITSPIIFKVFEARDHVRDMTLLMQREVADRIVAKPNCKAYGILSVISQAYTDVKNLLQVPRTVFSPRPKVDSSLVRWTFTNERAAQINDHQFFRDVVRRAFGQRRKMLRNSLKDILPEGGSVSIELTRRPEHLSVNEWIQLSNEIARLS